MDLSCLAPRLYIGASNALMTIASGRIILLDGGLSQQDITNMLSDDGAAGTGGALEGVKDLVDDYGGAGVAIFQNAGVYAAAIAVIVVIIACLLHARNSNELSIDKKAIPVVVICVILLFATTSFILFAHNIGSDLFSTATQQGQTQ